jgi:xanthine dehydrogenase accessory factor
MKISNFKFQISNIKIIIKGAGDVATGIAHRLYMAGLRNILMLEIPAPLCVRRTVAFSEAVYEGRAEVEGVNAELIRDLSHLDEVWGQRSVAVIVDPEWKTISRVKPDVVVDAIMAKRSLGTNKDEAPLVIGVGPGFAAPDDVHVVVETKRGHDLGRTIYNGSAEPHTGIPGEVMGYAKERVLRSPTPGLIRHIKKIGNFVKKGEIILYVGEGPVYSPFDGMLRGLIREIEVTAGEKIGDVDPRGISEYCYTISDKARAIGGGVLEAILHEMGRTGMST